LGPLGDSISDLKLLRVSGTELEVVNAARVSLGVHRETLDPDRDVKLIRYLARNKHTSPFEHVTMSFRVKCPLFVARQWMRHRMASYNEVSGRYTEVKEEYYTPTAWRRQAKSNRQVGDEEFHNQDLVNEFEVAVEDAFETYHRLLKNGVCREQARMVLPQCTYTEFYFSCNLLSLLNFLRLRLSSDAQWEIRVYAEEILRITEPLFPHTFRAWGITKAVTFQEEDA
jgi:thymidylate synthase (FAD)